MAQRLIVFIIVIGDIRWGNGNSQHETRRSKAFVQLPQFSFKTIDSLAWHVHQVFRKSKTGDES